jgi:superoxide reductase
MAAEYAIKQRTHKDKEKLISEMPEDVMAYIEKQVRRRNSMEELKIYRCRKCGKIVVMVHPSGCPTMCCGEEMELLKPNTVDAAVEKHVPVVTRENNVVTVSVGSTPHPMVPEHYIEFIILQSARGFRIAYLKPGDEPSVDFMDDEPASAVYAYCNLHGLWKTES